MKTKTTIKTKNGNIIVVRESGEGAKFSKGIRYCEYCGITFISSRKTAKYCSNSCRVMAFNVYK